jgi:hypothetical protein
MIANVEGAINLFEIWHTEQENANVNRNASRYSESNIAIPKRLLNAEN